jgi:hypothetical protein
VKSTFKPEGLVFGLILIVLGALWTLSNLGKLDLVQTLRTWWPLSLVLWGVLELAGALMRRQSGRS